ncbi:protein of unknown function [Methylorubrum extorquens]|uniref:Uncharacterized protein n=1 Tax=Methylorubrum extorquens TaxID=408 RepID=A0A2N9ALH0_METEX|nr:protein of unknown function [Methylorubrum extorquens]
MDGWCDAGAPYGRTSSLDVGNYSTDRPRKTGDCLQSRQFGPYRCAKAAFLLRSNQGLNDLLTLSILDERDPANRIQAK